MIASTNVHSVSRTFCSGCHTCNINDQCLIQGSLSQYKGTEWLGDDDSRLVVVRLRQDCTVDVVSLKAKHLRTINLASMNVVHVLLSSNKKRNVLLIRVPKEYDLVSRCNYRSLDVVLDTDSIG